MRILLTGANGQVGTALRESRPSSIDLIALDRHRLDVGDARLVEAALAVHKPRVVINCAAWTAVDAAESAISHAEVANVRAAENLARSCRMFGAVLIHLSTDYVFDGENPLPYVETDEPNPLSVYGRTKLQGEAAIRTNLHEHVILRTSWVYSAHGQNFVRTMLRLAGERTELRIVDDQIGSPTSARSIAQAVWRVAAALDRSAWGTFHYCAGDFTSWYGLAAALFEKADWIARRPHLVPIASEEFRTAALRPKNSRLNCGKIRDAYDIHPTTWQEDLAEVMQELAKATEKRV
jgi:dTDP-4-dehydrorhamnose reductase